MYFLKIRINFWLNWMIFCYFHYWCFYLSYNSSFLNQIVFQFLFSWFWDDLQYYCWVISNFPYFSQFILRDLSIICWYFSIFLVFLTFSSLVSIHYLTSKSIFYANWMFSSAYRIFSHWFLYRDGQNIVPKT